MSTCRVAITAPNAADIGVPIVILLLLLNPIPVELFFA